MSLCSETSSPLSSDTAQQFIKEYSELYDLVPNDIDALTHDAFQLLFNAIQQAKSLEKSAVRNTLDSLESFDGVTGAMRFDENGDPTKCAVIVRIDDDKFAYHDQVCPASS